MQNNNNTVTISLEDYVTLYELKKKIDSIESENCVFPVYTEVHGRTPLYKTTYYTKDEAIAELTQRISGAQTELHKAKAEVSESESANYHLALECSSWKNKHDEFESKLKKMNIFQLWKWLRSK